MLKKNMYDRKIIQNINLEMKQGENIAVIGDNGVRKNGVCENFNGIL